MRQACMRLVLLAAVLACTQGRAASLSVSPTGASLSARQPVATINLSNGDGEEKTIHAEVMRWRRENGEDVLEPSEDLIVSPPIFRIAAGASQIVRVGLDGPSAPADVEASYRLLLQELPPEKSEPGKIRMLLRLSLPIFIAPAGKPVEKLEWQLDAGAGGRLTLRLNNRGNKHVSIRQFALRPATGGGEVVAGPGPVDALAGEQRSLELKLPTQWHTDSAILSFETNDGSHEVTLPLARH